MTTTESHCEFMYIRSDNTLSKKKKEKLDQQSRSDRFFPVCYFISHLKQLSESDEGTYANTDERSLYVHTRLQDAICNKIKWNTRNNVKVQIDAYI